MNGTVCLQHWIKYCPTHAAAPEMLEALKGIAPYCKAKYGMDEKRVDAVEAAIATAGERF